MKTLKSTAKAVKLSTLLVFIVVLSACHHIPIHHGLSFGHGHFSSHSNVHLQAYDTHGFRAHRRTISVEH